MKWKLEKKPETIEGYRLNILFKDGKRIYFDDKCAGEFQIAIKKFKEHEEGDGHYELRYLEIVSVIDIDFDFVKCMILNKTTINK